MKLSHKLGILFNIEQGEGKLVAHIFLISFFLGSTLAFSLASCYTLFLSKFEAKHLPYVYIIVALAGTLITAGILQLERRISFSQLLSVILIFELSIPLILRGTLFFTPNKWIYFLLPVWHEVLICLTNIEFGSLVTQILTVRQGKRLLGLVSSGRFVAEICTGFLMGFIVNRLGTPNLLIIVTLSVGCTLSMVGVALSSSKSLNALQGGNNQKKEKKESEKKKISFKEMVKKRYIFLLFIYYILFLLAYYFVDNAFYVQASSKFSDSETLASFLGKFSATSGVFSIFSLTFLSGPVLNRYGLLAGLLILPLGLTVGALLVFISGALKGLGALVFWFTVMTQILRQVLNYSFNAPSRTILYQVLPANQRSWVQATVYGIIDPVFSGVSGLILLLLMQLFSFGTVGLFKVMFFILFGWVAIMFLIYKEYLCVLDQSLAKRRLGGPFFDIKDSSSLSIIKRGLISQYPAEVLYCLNLLQEIQSQEIEHLLVNLLHHPAEKIRQEAIHRIGKLGFTSSLDAVYSRFESEDSMLVKGETLRTMGALGNMETLEKVIPFCSHSDPTLRIGAMVGLVHSGEIEGVLTAGEKLISLVNSPNADERLFAAKVFGNIESNSFYRPLITLLNDEEKQVRIAALDASGKLKNRMLIPVVVKNFLSPDIHNAATSTLISMGKEVIPHLERLYEEKDDNTKIRSRILYIVGRVGGEKALNFLTKEDIVGDESIRHTLINALVMCKYKAEEDDHKIIQEMIEKEVKNITWFIGCLSDMMSEDSFICLTQALHYRVKKHQERILLLLSFIYSPQSILRAKFHLDNKSAEKRAYAIEVLDNLLSRDHKDMILPLVEDLDQEDRLRRLHYNVQADKKSNAERIREICQSHQKLITPWIRCSVLYVIGKHHYTEYQDCVIDCISSADDFVREIAIWALGKLNRDEIRKRDKILLLDTCPNVSSIVRSMINPKGEGYMLSTIEKVLILKTVTIFSEIPEEELVELALQVKEIEFKKGEPIITMGEYETSMYVIVSGKVRVHIYDRELEILGDRTVFGELAALEPEARSASITAVEDTFLFSVDQQTLYELLEEHIEVTRGIIQVLVRQIRRLNLKC